MRVLSPREIASSLAELWSPRVLAEVDDSYVKVARVEGEFPWHQHEQEDELFFVLAGRLILEMEDRSVELREGEMFLMPKGVRHHPIAPEECLVMLVERKSTAHSGDVVTEQTRSLADQLRPVI